MPWRLVGQTLWVRATTTTVAAYFEEERVATHSRRVWIGFGADLPDASGKNHRVTNAAAGSQMLLTLEKLFRGARLHAWPCSESHPDPSRTGPDKRSTVEEHLPEHRRAWRHRSREHWEGAADSMGPEVGQLIREIFDADDVLYQLRAVQSVYSLLEGYPPHRVAAACLRASFYGVTTYAGVKRILVNGLDLEPLPTAVTAPSGRLASPRFARNVNELFRSAGEASDEPH